MFKEDSYADYHINVTKLEPLKKGYNLKLCSKSPTSVVSILIPTAILPLSNVSV